MAIVTRRYKLTGPSNAALSLRVGASAAQNASFPVAVVDMDVDDAVAGSTVSLDEFMAQFGFVSDAVAVPSVPFATADKTKLDTVSSGATNTPLASTTPVAIVPDATGAVGVGTTAARADHTHAIVAAAPGTIAVGDAAAEGASTSFARSDHTHALTAPPAPADVTKAAASAGASTNVARADHKHDVSTAAAVELTDTTNAEGAATSLARSNHTHAHGNRGGGTLHAAATTSVAGFISAADKLKLDGLTPSFAMEDIAVFDHFQSGNVDTDEIGSMGWRLFVAGAGAGIAYASVAGRPGILQVNAGTAAAGRAAIGLGDASGVGGRIIVGGTNPIICETLVRFPAALDLTNSEEFTLGLGLDWDTDAELTNGIYFRRNSADTFWTLVTASGGVRSSRVSATAPVAGTWVRLGFSATATAVTFLLNGVAQGAVLTTNIPTAGLGFGMKHRSLGLGVAAVQCDYVRLSQVTNKEGT